MIERLAGPRTHICWTPDSERVSPLVSLVCEDDLAALEGEVQFLLDGLGVASLSELKLLVDRGRDYEALRESTGFYDDLLLGVPLS